MIRDIAGRQNHSVKLARKLQKKKHRRERGLLVCEGLDLLRAAVEADVAVHDVLVRRDLLPALPSKLVRLAEGTDEAGAGVDIGVCDQETLDFAGSLGGAVDVVFTCAQPRWGLADIDLGGRPVFFLDGVGDPGNVGTLVRSAAAFGLAAIICAPGTADPYGPKAMRAGMGAQFSVPVVTEVSPGDLAARFTSLASRGEAVPLVWAADPRGGTDIRDVETGTGLIIVLGDERTGPGPGWEHARRVSIPQESFDSLNVAMAGTVFAYELWRKTRGPALANGDAVR